MKNVTVGLKVDISNNGKVLTDKVASVNQKNQTFCLTIYDETGNDQPFSKLVEVGDKVIFNHDVL